MIPQDKVVEAIQSFCANEGWNKIFKSAPKGAMERLAIAFYYAKELIPLKESQNPADQDLLNEYRALREQVESELTVEDCQYLVDNMDDKKKPYYEKLLKQKQKDAEKDGGQAASGASPSPAAAEQQQQPAA